MAEPLKGCPFCGCEIHLRYDAKRQYFGPDGDHAGSCPISLDFVDYADKTQAIREWNTRATRPASPGLSEGDLEWLRALMPDKQDPASKWLSDEGRAMIAETNARIDRCLSALSAQAVGGGETYQARIDQWMREMFSAGGADLRTRMDRLIEEVFELAQAHAYDPGRIVPIRDYVYGRPIGDPAQEMGGVMVTLASLACAAGIDMQAEAEREFDRINTPEVRAKIMAKQASKNGLHTPLPTAEAAEALSLQGQAKPEEAGLCESEDPNERCLNCDCWKLTREMCS